MKGSSNRDVSEDVCGQQQSINNSRGNELCGVFKEADDEYEWHSHPGIISLGQTDYEFAVLLL